MKYMLMFWVDESAEPSPGEEEAASLAAIRSWVAEMTERGIRLHGSPLSHTTEGAIVRVRDGETLVSDGPYAETKEQVGGYDLIECADLDMAVAVAAAHPLASSTTVEVRPLEDLPGDLWRPALARRAVGVQLDPSGLRRAADRWVIDGLSLRVAWVDGNQGVISGA